MKKYSVFLKLIILLIIFSQILYHIEYKKSIPNINVFDGPFKMENYSFYNSLDFPLITIIIDLEKLKLDNLVIEYYIINLLNQTLKEIEIIIYCYYKECDNKTLKYNTSLYNKKIHNYNSKKNFIIDIFKIIDTVKGKFILLLNKMIKFDNDELNYFYHYTNGKINNIFNFGRMDNYELYLIRTKTIRDIEDDEKNFHDFKELINYIEFLPEPSINYIPIALSPNDKYTPLAYTSMLSILNTKNYYSYIDFYLIIPKNFSSENFILLNSLFEQFNFFNITYIYMNERYQNAFVHRYITTQAYYRFSLGELLPKLNKIIYLDADIICFDDLSKLYDLNFRGKIILAKGLSQNKTNVQQYFINSGILLFNLKKMRRMRVEEKVLKILKSGFSHPTLHDQAIIDTFFYKYVGLFPPEFNAYLLNFEETSHLISTTKIYDKDKLLFSLKYPSIRHYKGDKKNLNDDWFYFARMSKYFNKISQNYSNIYHYSKKKI